MSLGWGLRLTISKTSPSVAGAAGVRSSLEEQGSRTKGTFYISHDYIKLHKTLNPETPFPICLKTDTVGLYSLKVSNVLCHKSDIFSRWLMSFFL